MVRFCQSSKSSGTIHALNLSSSAIFCKNKNSQKIIISQVLTPDAYRFWYRAEQEPKTVKICSNFIL